MVKVNGLELVYSRNSLFVFGRDNKFRRALLKVIMNKYLYIYLISIIDGLIDLF
jgi:hypothetical protein